MSDSREEKRNRFVQTFIEQKNWQDDDLLSFIVDEFHNDVDDVNWILKVTLDQKPYKSYKIFELVMRNGVELRVLNDLGQTAIHVAALNEEHRIMSLLSRYFGDENLSDARGFTYFHAACWYNCHEQAQRFIDRGVNVDLTFEKDGREESALSLCIEDSLGETIELLLKNGADIDSLEEWREDHLSRLKETRDPDCEFTNNWAIVADHHFKRLLRRSGKVENLSDAEGFTYLHAACIVDNVEMVRKFVDQKTDLDCVWRAANGTAETPLTLATRYKEIEIIELLLQNGADPNVKRLGKNPLHVFFESFTNDPVDSDLLDLLVRYKCDVNAKDRDGRSPLFLCYENCNEKYNCFEPQPWANATLAKLFSDRRNLETLLKNKADVKEVFEGGRSILHLFIDSDICRLSKIDEAFGYRRNVVGIALIKTLLKHGSAEVNVKDDDGDSPLHLAVMSNNLDAVEVLLAHGADVKSVDLAKIHWDYDWSVSWWDRMIRFFLILQRLKGKGYKMTDSSCSEVLKFLINELNPNEASIAWERTMLLGSPARIRSLLASLKNVNHDDDDDEDQLEDSEKYYLAELLHTQLRTSEKGNTFMQAETKDALRQLQRFFKLEQTDVRRLNRAISMEIENVKKLRIKDDGASLFDVCTYEPDKAYRAVEDSKIWTVMNSKKFLYKCNRLSSTIKGYVLNCFARKFFKDVGTKYLTLLARRKLPALCCERIFQYLSYEDVSNLCQIYVNKV